MGGLFLLGSVFGVLAILVPVSLVLGLVVVLALRGEPDDGGRGMTLYLALASFVGFLTVLIAVTALAAAATDLVANDDEDEVSFPSVTSFDSGSSSSSGSSSDNLYDLGSSGDASALRDAIARNGGTTGTIASISESHEQTHDDRAWTAIIQALLALAAALAVLRFHWPKLEAVGNRAEATVSAVKAREAYCYTMCFLVVVTLLVAATVATFNVVQMIAPGTTGAHDRGDAIEAFIPVFVLAVGALGLFRVHWARIDPPAFLRRLPPPPPPSEPPEIPLVSA